MPQNAIVAPMAAFTALLFLLWARLGYVRITAAATGAVSEEYQRIGRGPEPAEGYVRMHHHFANAFEVPILFYLACVALRATESVDIAAVWIAWGFVALRLLHTALVLTRNVPRERVVPYVLSSFAVWALWVLLALRTSVWAL